MARVLEHFYYPILTDPVFSSKAEEWASNRLQFRWDTSLLKTIDNLVIGISALGTKPTARAAASS
jgi:hypothetical protein